MRCTAPRHDFSIAIENARWVVLHPEARTPPSLRQWAWAVLKTAQGRPVRQARLRLLAPEERA